MAIEFKDLTTGEHEGRGAFDELMRTAESHLEREFSSNRINSNEYATVYLGTLNASMSAALQYVLGNGIASRQEELLSNQGLKVIQDTLVVAQQLVNLQKEELLADAEILLKAQELINITAQNVLVIAQTAKITADKLVADKQLLVMDAEILKINADISLIDQEVLNKISQELLIDKQGVKMDNEILLLIQKTRTEEAQILDTVNDNTVTGVIGKQKTLYAAQEAGFARDAEQKLLKFYTDNWGLRLNSDPLTVLPGGFSNTEIDKILAKAKAGIDVQ
jgi:hypothetical protein